MRPCVCTMFTFFSIVTPVKIGRRSALGIGLVPLRSRSPRAAMNARRKAATRASDSSGSTAIRAGSPRAETNSLMPMAGALYRGDKHRTKPGRRPDNLLDSDRHHIKLKVYLAKWMDR